MMIKTFAIGAFCASLTFTAQATEKMYGVVTSGYSDVTFLEQGLELDNVNYSLALGHQFKRQWYAEAGVREIIDGEGEMYSMQASSLYLAVLGKAGHQVGELFYKLGVMNIDVQGYQPANGEECPIGNVSLITKRCEFDEGLFGGMVALGFDYHLSLRTMVRFEIEHIRGENDFKANLVNLGIRYNFN
ncbi:outer membrane beta-barrel protein [Alteromonas sp. ASW11-130]|uniref:outer membrane beta-barrel protein n=1 Tax=Alteromonas sp. ASW11-130 TaxID=3015775 RepID=UPI0022420C6C|nr:outer membrane beta-barrel protein [Alteromonas sp. ASW11-130]MCW8091251.1 outer membrane beta-barrel protein [Alteromonas sp. ASW11-130]